MKKFRLGDTCGQGVFSERKYMLCEPSFLQHNASTWLRKENFVDFPPGIPAFLPT